MTLSKATEWENRFLGSLDTISRQWAVIGQMVAECKANEYYRELGYGSFEAWVEANKARIGRCRATIFHSQRLQRQLTGILEQEEMLQIPRANAELLCSIPEQKVRQVVGAAKTESEETFYQTIKSKFGQWLNPERKRRWCVTVDQSLYDRIEEVMAEAKQRFETESNAVALEGIMQHFMENGDAD